MASVGSLTGRLALVTGGGSGIGRAVCRLFAREGARVAVVDVNEGGAAETAQLIGDQHKFFSADISKKAAVDTLVQNVESEFSQVPCIAVNAAGITRDQFLLKMDEKAFDDVIAVNLKGTYLVTQSLAKRMVKAKVENGSIVNISSITGKIGNAGQINYTATKAGVVGMTKTTAKELAKFGIRCNAVMPGFIDTPMVETVPDHILNMMKMLIPLGRTGKPEEIAEACLFLASPRSSYVTGSVLEVTGGFFM